MIDFVYCPFGSSKCFAYEKPNGICGALQDVDFGNRKECPFFKDANQQAVEMVESMKRMKAIKKAKEAKNGTD